jgi:hypothetical protein
MYFAEFVPRWSYASHRDVTDKAIVALYPNFIFVALARNT